MRYFEITVNTPYAGTENTDYIAVNSIDDAERYADDFCQQNAEDYTYLINGWDGEDPTEEELEEYYDDCEWCAFEISEEQYLENTNDI